VPEVSDRTEQLGGLPVFWREAPPLRGLGDAPPLYLHGVPTSSDDWIPFLERTGGLAVDLPGFGRSGKPGDRRYTMEEYGDFLEGFLELVETPRVRLVVHDWGVVGLVTAQRRPERIARLVLINAVPLLPGYRWHRIARIWRTPGLGELAMGATTRTALKLLTRDANATPGPLPDDLIDGVLAHFDQGTQRAILRLYRSSPPEALERAGARLGELEMPSLVLWGTRDPYISDQFALEYARRLPSSELAELADAGHWPWLDRPDVIGRIADFLTADDAG
jgi:pimeloyl-ACP methyl ester carboxylesterase